MLFAHGFNDWNVMPDNTIRMWEALKKINPSAKIYMSQGGHGAPPPADIQNKWWAHYLYGVNNGVDSLPREKKTVKILRRDRLNFGTQPIDREPMNSRQ